MEIRFGPEDLPNIIITHTFLRLFRVLCFLSLTRLSSEQQTNREETFKTEVSLNLPEMRRSLSLSFPALPGLQWSQCRAVRWGGQRSEEVRGDPGNLILTLRSPDWVRHWDSNWDSKRDSAFSFAQQTQRLTQLEHSLSQQSDSFLNNSKLKSKKTTTYI